jgi:hypothetical protein
MFRSKFGLDWKKSPAHLLLLSKFREPRNIEDVSRQDYWQDVLNEQPLKAINRFIKDGMITEGDIYSCMQYRFKVSELKPMLKERGLKQSGRKEELIFRLVENDPEGMKKAISGLKIYKCSSIGVEIAEDYLEREKQKRIVAENETISYLRKRKFNQASKAVAAYEAGQVFPRGMGIDWQNHDTGYDERLLNYVFNNFPSILDGLEKDKREPLRIVAGMEWLWGSNRGDAWIDDNFKTGIKFDADISARMIWFHAKYLVEIEDYQRDNFFKKVGITGANDSFVCDECKVIQGKKFNLNQVPELPFPTCTSESGCRCLTVVGFDLG